MALMSARMEGIETDKLSRSIETGEGVGTPGGLVPEGRHPTVHLYHPVLSLDEVCKDVQTLHFEVIHSYAGIEALQVYHQPPSPFLFSTRKICKKKPSLDSVVSTIAPLNNSF